ncbi:carbohydrate kinase [Siculibacillus lacustris]|uniref:Carbohydrate kinase n=1 Tax=Siculibacillus lacustris TaxID=1549641 RepID=A0A4Q9VFA4_9HYPH|nr:carbohydrate kinase [Siculibacillus lacustris]TBW33570.1 carbohydrate kinase [Siculibacillus lacustris]
MILSTGEALFDMISVDVDGRRLFEPVIGGSPLNVALGLSRLGRDTAYLTSLSTDMFGDRLWEFLGREGIDRRFVVRAARPTTMAFVAIDAAGQPNYAFYADAAADRSLTEADLPTVLPDELACVHFGSVSLVLEPTASTLHGFLKRVGETRVISLDPNIRASLIGDRPAYLARFADVLARADLVKASIEDVEWLYGETDAAAVAERWSLAGPRLAVVTDGGRGATVAVAGRSRFVPAVPVTVIDTVGAGDTFQAALIDRLADRDLLSKAKLATVDLDTLEPVIRFAAAAAALTCSRRGADLPRLAEVRAFMAERGL